jgi:hypothetical protein
MATTIDPGARASNIEHRTGAHSTSTATLPQRSSNARSARTGPGTNFATWLGGYCRSSALPLTNLVYLLACDFAFVACFCASSAVHADQRGSAARSGANLTTVYGLGASARSASALGKKVCDFLSHTQATAKPHCCGKPLNATSTTAIKPLWAINGKTVARRLAHETGSDR